MVIISKSILLRFIEKHPDAKKSKLNWYEITKSSDWSHFADLKATFNTSDSVGNNRYVFDLKGNQYRLIALIVFKVRTIYIVFIGTHKEYDKVDASNVEYKK